MSEVRSPARARRMSSPRTRPRPEGAEATAASPPRRSATGALAWKRARPPAPGIAPARRCSRSSPVTRTLAAAGPMDVALAASAADGPAKMAPSTPAVRAANTTRHARGVQRRGLTPGPLLPPLAARSTHGPQLPQCSLRRRHPSQAPQGWPVTTPVASTLALSRSASRAVG